MIQLTEKHFLTWMGNLYRDNAYITDKNGKVLQDNWKAAYNLAEKRGFLKKRRPRTWELTELGKTMMKLTE